MSRALDAIVDEALELDPSEWPRFLKAACGDDAALHDEASSLLAMHVAHPGALQPGPPVSSAAPSSIGGYTVHREIARGGMGIVYEASDDALRRRIALKVLPARLADDPAWLRRFRREAKHLAAVEHPNVANIHTLEEDDGLHFLTMDLLEGEPLSERLDEGAPPYDTVVALTVQIARALEAMHRRGIVHCDLKPANVLVSADDRVTVIDFGLARRGAGGPGESGAAAASGTPGYMAPEQIEARPVDHRADVWAFGCVAYECLTGEPAFPGEVERRLRDTMERDPDFGRLAIDTPQPVRDLLARCLAKDPARRPEMREVRRVLEAERTEGERHAFPGADDRLPRWDNAFVGRDDEVRGLVSRLTRGGVVTLTGSAGCGKTRLAVEVGRRLLATAPDGVWFVDLAAAAPGDVPAAVAGALDLPLDPSGPPLEGLADALADKTLALILDRTEHLAAELRSLMKRLLDREAKIVLLATSREPLGMAGETVHAVVPLPRPDPAVSWAADDLRAVDSVRLFLARAADAGSSIPLTDDNAGAVARVCHALEGIPLAIELVASRADEAVAGGTSQPMAADVEEVVRWSFDRLSADERAVFERVSRCVGGWTLDAATGMCADAVPPEDVPAILGELRRKSLVEFAVGARAVSDKARFRMLGPLRTFARSQRSEDERRADTMRHLSVYLELAESEAPRLRGREQTAALAALAADHDNLRSALETCLEPATDARLGLRLVAALELFWVLRGHWREGTRYADALLDRADGREPSPARGHALNASAVFHLNMGEPDVADARYDEALAVGRAIGDREVIARSIHNKGGVALGTGRLEDARTWFESYIEMMEADGNRGAEARARSNLGVVAERAGRLDDAKEQYERALELFPEDEDPRMAAVLLNNLGSVSLSLGEYDAARRRLEESLALHRDSEDSWNAAQALNLLGAVAEEERDLETSRAHFRESLRIMGELGNVSGVCTVLTQLAISDARIGEHARAATLLGAVGALRAAIGEPLPPSHAGPVDDATSAARAALGDAFTAHRERGAAFDVTGAVAFVLEGDGAR